MPKDIQVLIAEDDPYARDLMALLLTRDWRTRVVAEVGTLEDVHAALMNPQTRVDVLVLDTEVPGQPDLPLAISQAARSLLRPPRILYTGTRPRGDTLHRLSQNGFDGYLIKGEIHYALASAVAYAAAGSCVITPGVRAFAEALTLPAGTIVLDGRTPVANFTLREAEIARLAIIFNLALRDIADELVVSSGWASEVVSAVYEKLGLRELLSGETPLDAFFEEPGVSKRIHKILRRTSHSGPSQSSRKAPWMATLAFHLLTIPLVEGT